MSMSRTYGVAFAEAHAKQPTSSGISTHTYEYARPRMDKEKYQEGENLQYL
jgi:hypothetical protein